MQGIIFKIIGGTRAYELRFTAMSNQHAQTLAMDAEQKERLTWWLSRSEYVHETPYYAVTSICINFGIHTDDFYSLFAI
jgi:hypothetical protein